MLLQDSPDIKTVLSDAEEAEFYIYLLCCMIGTFESRGGFGNNLADESGEHEKEELYSGSSFTRGDKEVFFHVFL